MSLDFLSNLALRAAGGARTLRANLAAPAGLPQSEMAEVGLESGQDGPATMEARPADPGPDELAPVAVAGQLALPGMPTRLQLPIGRADQEHTPAVDSPPGEVRSEAAPAAGVRPQPIAPPLSEVVTGSNDPLPLASHRLADERSVAGHPVTDSSASPGDYGTWAEPARRHAQPPLVATDGQSATGQPTSVERLEPAPAIAQIRSAQRTALSTHAAERPGGRLQPSEPTLPPQHSSRAGAGAAEERVGEDALRPQSATSREQTGVSGSGDVVSPPWRSAGAVTSASGSMATMGLPAEPPAAPTVVRVSIGRVELRAAAPPARPAPAPRPRPAVSLDDFLSRQDKRRR